MEKLLIIGFLILASWSDIKRREISTSLIIVFGIIGIVLFFIQNRQSFYSLMCGLLIGVLVILLSCITHGEIGIGDGLILIDTGVYLGGFMNLELLIGGLLLSALFSCLVFIFKKNIKQEIPFVPFLLISYLILEIL